MIKPCFVHKSDKNTVVLDEVRLKKASCQQSLYLDSYSSTGGTHETPLIYNTTDCVFFKTVVYLYVQLKGIHLI